MMKLAEEQACGYQGRRVNKCQHGIISPVT